MESDSDESTSSDELIREEVILLGVLLCSIKFYVMIKPELRDTLQLLERRSFWGITSTLSTEEFRLPFRVHRNHFKELTDKVRRRIEKHERMGSLRNGELKT